MDWLGFAWAGVVSGMAADTAARFLQAIAGKEDCVEETFPFDHVLDDEEDLYLNLRHNLNQIADRYARKKLRVFVNGFSFNLPTEVIKLKYTNGTVLTITPIMSDETTISGYKFSAKLSSEFGIKFTTDFIDKSIEQLNRPITHVNYAMFEEQKIADVLPNSGWAIRYAKKTVRYGAAGAVVTVVCVLTGFITPAVTPIVVVTVVAAAAAYVVKKCASWFSEWWWG